MQGLWEEGCPFHWRRGHVLIKEYDNATAGALALLALLVQTRAGRPRGFQLHIAACYSLITILACRLLPPPRLDIVSSISPHFLLPAACAGAAAGARGAVAAGAGDAGVPDVGRGHAALAAQPVERESVSLTFPHLALFLSLYIHTCIYIIFRCFYCWARPHCTC